VRLEGIHHITAVTGDAARNVEFYTGLIGLRLVKKSVNQDDPTVYHLFYADELGSAGSDLTFFEYKDAPEGRAGAGMVYRIIWRVASEEALEFWQERLTAAGIGVKQQPGSIVFLDPEGLELELKIDGSSDAPLRASHPEIPIELAISGFDGARAYTSDSSSSTGLLSEALGFTGGPDVWQVSGDHRTSQFMYDEAPSARGLSGAGTVHHIAWASAMDQHEAWRKKVAAAGAAVTEIIDRYYFRSIYFREPSGVLFEIATIGPGFSVDEPPGSLGERLALPPRFESLRSQLEDVLTPLPNPRARLIT